MATAVNKLKCGGTKRKGMANGGTVTKGDPPYIPKKGDTSAQLGAHFYANLDDQASYSDEGLFGSAGKVAGIYDDIKFHAKREGLTDWREKQAKFIKNVDKYSPYYHAMRQADLTKKDTDYDNPGIVGEKGFSPIAKNTPAGAAYLKNLTGGVPLDLSSRKGVTFSKRWHRYHGSNLKEYPKAGKVEQVYDVAWGKKATERARIPKEQWEKTMADYKDAGNKVNFQEGGEVYNPGTYDQMPGTSVGASNALGLPTGNEGLGTGMGSNIGGVLSSGIGMVSDIGVNALQESKTQDLQNYDPRDNPTELLDKANAKDTGSALLKGAGKGAAAGAMFGPIGAGIGAAAGVLISGLGRLIGKKGRDEETSKATSNWSAGRTGLQASYERQSGYKEGGEIKGKGSGKSDSINMTAKDGSFIVPAENAEAGMDLGKTYLGWNKDTVAERQNGGDGVKVSNGEVFFTPEEANTLKYYGINLDSLAPNAEPENRTAMNSGIKKTPRLKKGGWKYDTESGWVVDESNDIAYDKEGNEYTKDTSGNMTLSSEGTMVGKSIYAKHGAGQVTAEADKPVDQADPGKEAEEFSNKWYDYVPELAGTIQTLGGAAGLIASGRRPDISVSRTLKKLSAETRRLAQFGYEPQVLNALDTQIEKARRDVTKSITGRGGSPMEVMAQLQSTLGTVIDKKAGVMMANAQEKSRKWADVLRIDSQVAGQEFDIQKINLEDWYKTQDVYANMLSAGISNTIGARQLKTEQDLMRDIKTSPTFSRT